MTDATRSRAANGWRRWYRTPRKSTTSKVPIRSGEQIHHVDVDVLDARGAGFAGELEARLGSPATAVPRVVVGRDHPRRPATLGFEREESVPGADIEDAASGERLREVEARETEGRVVHTPGDNAVTEVDRVIPPHCGCPRGEIRSRDRHRLHRLVFFDGHRRRGLTRERLQRDRHRLADLGDEMDRQLPAGALPSGPP